MALNLARRPFVDTRPANALTALLVVLVLGLSVESWRTLMTYVQGSRGTQVAIAELRSEISRADARRKAAEAAVSRYDIEELGMAAEDANAIAQRRAFSWTRFLTRLEEALPHEVRVVTISLGKSKEEAKTGKSTVPAEGAMPLQLQLVSRDPLGLPKTIRALYASPWFDMPVPQSDQGQETAGPEGRRIAMSVLYLDAGRGAARPSPAPGASAASAASAAPAAPAARASRPAAGKGRAR